MKNINKAVSQHKENLGKNIYTLKKKKTDHPTFKRLMNKKFIRIAINFRGKNNMNSFVDTYQNFFFRYEPRVDGMFLTLHFILFLEF